MLVFIGKLVFFLLKVWVLLPRLSACFYLRCNYPVKQTQVGALVDG